MSGYIQLWKELLTDPKFRRLVRDLNARVPGGREHAETLALGCLAKLWLFADSHIRDDDTIAFGPHEIQEILGVADIVEILPPNWLEVLDAEQVRLPNYQSHNGIAARKRAQATNRKRLQRERDSTLPPVTDTVTQERDKSVTGGVTPLPFPSLPIPTLPSSEQNGGSEVLQGEDARARVLALADRLRTTT